MSNIEKDDEKEHTHKPEEIRSGEWKKKTFSVGEKKKTALERLGDLKERMRAARDCRHKDVVYNFTFNFVQCKMCKYQWSSIEAYKEDYRNNLQEWEKDAKQKC